MYLSITFYNIIESNDDAINIEVDNIRANRPTIINSTNIITYFNKFNIFFLHVSDSCIRLKPF